MQRHVAALDELVAVVVAAGRALEAVFVSSRFAGDVFLDWLAPAPGLRWVDIGCGNGAFSECIVERCAPAEVQGVDPSGGQLAFARTRPAARLARFQQGDAMALPFPDASFDAAVMALVIFFVPDPAKGLSEMVRVLRPGGTMAAYAWDMLGGGFPLEPIFADLLSLGRVNRPPRAWLGMYTTESNGQIVVGGLAKSGPADRAGVRLGDLVMEVAGERVTALADLFRKVWRLGPAGIDVPLTLARDGSLVRVTLQSADRNEFLKKPQLH